MQMYNVHTTLEWDIAGRYKLIDLNEKYLNKC